MSGQTNREKGQKVTRISVGVMKRKAEWRALVRWRAHLPVILEVAADHVVGPRQGARVDGGVAHHAPLGAQHAAAAQHPNPWRGPRQNPVKREKALERRKKMKEKWKFNRSERFKLRADVGVESGAGVTWRRRGDGGRPAWFVDGTKPSI